MATWRTDPYLWVHLAGLATVPLWLDLCLLGLAVGNPTLPGLELGAIAVLGVLPVLAMQLLRPFYIFSLPGLVLKPRALRPNQRQLLTRFRSWRSRLGALLVPVPLVWLLLKLYPLAFLARELTPFGDWGRFGGVAIAIVGFALANLFLQVPVAVLQVLATPDRRMAAIAPYPAERVAADFMVLGLPVGRLLPDLVELEASPPRSVPGVAVAPAVEIPGPPPARVDGVQATEHTAEQIVLQEVSTENPVVEQAAAEAAPEDFAEAPEVSALSATPESESSTEAGRSSAIAEASAPADSELAPAKAPALEAIALSPPAASGSSEAEWPQDAEGETGPPPAEPPQADLALPASPTAGAASGGGRPLIHPELDDSDLEPVGVDAVTADHAPLAATATPASAPGQRHNS